MVPLIELSTLDLEEMQLPRNLSLTQHPISSSSAPPLASTTSFLFFFFTPFDFPTSQLSTLPFSPPNPISLSITPKHSNPTHHHNHLISPHPPTTTGSQSSLTNKNPPRKSPYSSKKFHLFGFFPLRLTKLEKPQMAKQLDHRVKIKFLTKILKTQNWSTCEKLHKRRRRKKKVLSLNQREATNLSGTQKCLLKDTEISDKDSYTSWPV